MGTSLIAVLLVGVLFGIFIGTALGVTLGLKLRKWGDGPDTPRVGGESKSSSLDRA